MRSPLGGIRADEFERVSSSRRLISPVGGKSDECCGANDSGLAVLIGHLRPDVDQSQLKNQLTQLLQRRMVQVSDISPIITRDTFQILNYTQTIKGRGVSEGCAQLSPSTKATHLQKRPIH